MKKKILSAMLCITLGCSLLTGCAGKDEPTVETQQEVEGGSEDTGLDEGDANVEDANEDGIYTISSAELGMREIKDFFDVWLSCQIDQVYRKPNTKFTDLYTMLECSSTSIIELRKKLHVGEWNDENFKGLRPDYSNDFYHAIADRDQVNYKTTSAVLLSNINNFKYYAGTDAVISLVVSVDCYVGNELAGNWTHDGDNFFAVTLINDAQNPEEWLITGVYRLNTYQGKTLTEEMLTVAGDVDTHLWNNENNKARDNGFDIMTELVSEDHQKDVEEVASSGLPEYVEAYTTAVGDDFQPWMYMVKTNDSEIPYLFKLSDSGVKLYHYDNGSVIEKQYLVYSHFIDLLLIKDAVIVCDYLMDYELDRSYTVCGFSDGIINNTDDFFEGEYIEESDYENYKKNGILLDTSNSHETVKGAYENMIIWE